MLKHRVAILASICVLLLVVVAVFFRVWRERAPEARMRVALVGFFESDVETLRAAARELNTSVDVYTKSDFSAEPLDDVRYDAILYRTIGFAAEDDSETLRANLAKADAVIPYPNTVELFQKFARVPKGFEEARYAEYFSTLTERNAKSIMLLALRELASADVEVPPVEEPPLFGFFYRGKEICPDFDEWLRRSDIPELPDDAPRVALIGPFMNPFKSIGDDVLTRIVDDFAKRGLRAVPIYNFRNNLDALEAIRPDIIVLFPLGKILPNDEATPLLSRIDAPVLTAVNLSVSNRRQLSEPVGMTTNYQNLAIAIPELDGAIEPTPISTLEPTDVETERRTPIDERIERLADRAARWVALRRKPNNEKKIAIYFRRSPGAAAITAQSLDAIPSLYNFLNSLRGQGYDLGTVFPETEEEFKRIVDERGRTIGQWAPGALVAFLENARPARLKTTQYVEFLRRDLSEKARADLQSVWGAPPGVYFSGQTNDGESFIAVSRIEFGNVAILPQPTTAIISDDPNATDFDSAHGTNKSPPHFYVASYLWSREVFGADAFVHFGTHGSLEFTKGKSMMNSQDCWPDALIGDLPNIYLYSINNVGEALLAKRRIRATLVSHTTPPFTEAKLADENAKLERLLDKLELTEDERVKDELANEIQEQARAAGLVLYDSEGEALDAEALEEFYREQLHRLEETDVAEGLHVLGREWSEEQIERTAAAIGVEGAAERVRESVGGVETERLIAALDGRFIPASSGGDPLVNPDSLPTGRNISGINIEQTPDEATQRVAEKLLDEFIDGYRAKNGRYPRRLAFTFWGGEYIRTRGMSVAQALYALGVRPKFDSRGTIRDLEVIDSETLGRPRIDVMAQTSGQFRDAAGSRIELLDRAVRIAAELPDEPFENYVKEHSNALRQKLLGEGYVEEEARELSTARVFGSTRALDYGTGIRRTVERSDRWRDRKDIADQYVLNMSGVYRNGRVWGAPVKGLLEANLTDVDALMQSRSSNLWGPIKLDHMYEFGTLGLVAREKGGADPQTWLTDGRKGASKAKLQTLEEAARDELQTTFWNRSWLEALMREKGGGASALEKGVQNLFGWSAVGPEGMIDERMWNRTYETYVEDSLGLGMKEYFETTDPGALMNISAVMLDATRKGFWTPSDEIIENLANIHLEELEKFGPCCSYNTCGNVELREYIESRMTDADAERYRTTLDAAIATESNVAVSSGIELEEVETRAIEDDAQAALDELEARAPRARVLTIWLIAALIFAFGALAPKRSRREASGA